VKQAQILQPRLDELVLRVVRDDGFGPKDEQVILKEARMRLGDSIRIKFEYVATLERTANGKLRFIVSQLPREQLEFSKP
jgi:phenylacetate-CoA ligase